MIRVILPPDRLEEAVTAGALRRVDAITNGRPDTYAVFRPDAKPRWQENVTAAIAEMAVCMVYGHRFSGALRNATARQIARLKDAGPLEVRTLQSETHHLLAYSKDAPHQKIVASYVRDNEVLLLGWATAQEIRTYGKRVVGMQHGLLCDELNDMFGIGYAPIPGTCWHYTNQ